MCAVNRTCGLFCGRKFDKAVGNAENKRGLIMLEFAELHVPVLLNVSDMMKIGFENKTQRLFRWIGLCFFIVLLGCGTEDVGQQAECVRNDDCVAPKTCNVVQGICEHVRTEPGRPTGPGELPGSGSDAGTTPSQPSDTGDASDASDAGTVQPTDSGSGSSDTGVDTGANTQPDVAPDVQEPELTMCEAISQSCDLSRPVQGDFVCVEGGGLGSICLQRCTQADHPSTCDAGFYCREHVVNGTVVLGCAVGGCVSNRDCDHIGPVGGNCIDQGNGYRECVEGGTILEGQACQGGAADQCMEGTRCRITKASTNTGVCSRLCDPWSPVFTCANDSYCEPFNATQGVCNNNVVTNSVRYYYDPCSPIGAMCSDATKCVGFNDGSTHCVPQCRVGKNDCSGLRKPWGGGWFDPSSPTSCQPRDFPGTEQLGYCL